MMSRYCWPEQSRGVVSRSAMARNSSGAPWRRVFIVTPYGDTELGPNGEGWGGSSSNRVACAANGRRSVPWFVSGWSVTPRFPRRVVPWCIAAARVWWHSYAYIRGDEGAKQGAQGSRGTKACVCAQPGARARRYRIPGTYIPGIR